ncbi:MAG: ATP12 family protein [Beijerinckiaceae bacterium]
MVRDPVSPFQLPGSTPQAAASAAMRPVFPKRFWSDVAMVASDDGYALHLDGKPARTPARNLLTAPTLRAADVLSQEWRAVGERLDPASMPLTRLVNSALDGVAKEVEAVRADIVKYAGSDLVCYRAVEPETLVARQIEHWDPVLAWAQDELGTGFALSEGVIHTEQPKGTLDAIKRAVDLVPVPHALAGLHSVVTLTGSTLLALAMARNFLSPDAVWTAAHVDEDAQMAIWGADEEALARRAARRAEFDAAAILIAA